MRIDAATHIAPAKYVNAMLKKVEIYKTWQQHQSAFPALTNLDIRFKGMDKFGDYAQVITLTFPFVETVAKPKDAIELAKIGNDALAELVAKYPDRFLTAAGNLPMNDIDASLVELDRVIKELGFKGIQLLTDINGKALDSPEFYPIYEKMQGYDLPILLHPYRPERPDYVTEDKSKHGISSMIGWPYETTAAMIRLVAGGVMQKYPKIKFITHHCGAMLPFFEQRIARSAGGRWGGDGSKDTKTARDYFKMFYADSAVGGSTPAITCGLAFFGSDHILFGSDTPYGGEDGSPGVQHTITAIEQLSVTAAEKKKLFEGNTRKVFHLPVKRA